MPYYFCLAVSFRSLNLGSLKATLWLLQSALTHKTVFSHKERTRYEYRYIAIINKNLNSSLSYFVMQSGATRLGIKCHVSRHVFKG